MENHPTAVIAAATTATTTQSHCKLISHFFIADYYCIARHEHCEHMKRYTVNRTHKTVFFCKRDFKYTDEHIHTHTPLYTRKQFVTNWNWIIDHNLNSPFNEKVITQTLRFQVYFWIWLKLRKEKYGIAKLSYSTNHWKIHIRLVWCISQINSIT